MSVKMQTQEGIRYWDAAPTVAALNAATTIAELDAVLVYFQLFYGLDVTFMTGPGTGAQSITWTGITPAQFQAAQQTAVRVVEEFVKYPPEFVVASQLTYVRLVRGLTFPVSAVGAWSVVDQTIYISTGDVAPNPYVNNVVHHEFAHCIEDSATTWDIPRQNLYAYFNPSNYASTVGPDRDAGFISAYANTNIHEDFAETHCLFMTAEWHDYAVGVAASDPVVAYKHDMIIQILMEVDSSIPVTFYPEVFQPPPPVITPPPPVIVGEPDFILTVIPDSELDAKFDPRSGRTGPWLGGDIAFTVALGDGRILWGFGDTFWGNGAGPWRDRSNATFLHDSLAIQSKPRLRDATVTFHRRPTGGEWFLVDGTHQAWAQSGIVIDGDLYVMSFRMLNADLDFNAGWCVHKVTGAATSSISTWDPQLVYASGDTDTRPVVSPYDGGDGYIYAWAIKFRTGWRRARWTKADFTGGGLGNVTWWDGASWVSDVNSALHLGDSFWTSEGTVHQLEDGTWLEIESGAGFPGAGLPRLEVQARRAGNAGEPFYPLAPPFQIKDGVWDLPTGTTGLITGAPGPETRTVRIDDLWGGGLGGQSHDRDLSELTPTTRTERSIYTPPEVSIEDGFIYGARAHPEVSDPGIVLTYIASRPFSQLVGDMSLYWPRFVRVITDPSQLPSPEPTGTTRPPHYDLDDEPGLGRKAPIDITIYNDEYRPLGRVADYTSVEATWQYLGVGTGTLVVDHDHWIAKHALSIKHTVLPITIDVRGRRWSGRAVSARQDKKADGSGSLALTLVDDFAWLNAILTWPWPLFNTIAEQLNPSVLAASLILDRFNSNLEINTIFWTWDGAPAVVDEWNDWLLNIYNTNYSGSITDLDEKKRMLKDYIATWLNDVRVGQPGKVCCELIQVNVDRLGLPIVTIPPVVETGAPVRIMARFKPVADYVVPILQQAQINLQPELWLPGEPLPQGVTTLPSRATIFLRAVPATRKPWLRWSDDVGGIESSTVEVKATSAYQTVLGGAGQDADKVLALYVNPLDASPYAFPEHYVDHSEAVTVEELMAFGPGDQAEDSGESSVSMTVIDGVPWAVGTDYWLGDVPTVELSGIPFEEQITGITVSHTKGDGLRFSPKLGRPEETTEDIIFNAISSMARQIRSIQIRR